VLTAGIPPNREGLSPRRAEKQHSLPSFLSRRHTGSQHLTRNANNIPQGKHVPPRRAHSDDSPKNESVPTLVNICGVGKGNAGIVLKAFGFQVDI
jgi:hypothetical protein